MRITILWLDTVFVILFAIFVLYHTRQELFFVGDKIKGFISKLTTKQELPPESIKVLAKGHHSLEPYRLICDDIVLGYEQYLMKNIDEALHSDLDIIYTRDRFLAKHAGESVVLRLKSSNLFDFKKINGLKVKLDLSALENWCVIRVYKADKRSARLNIYELDPVDEGILCTDRDTFRLTFPSKPEPSSWRLVFLSADAKQESYLHFSDADELGFLSLFFNAVSEDRTRGLLVMRSDSIISKAPREVRILHHQLHLNMQAVSKLSFRLAKFVVSEYESHQIRGFRVVVDEENNYSFCIYSGEDYLEAAELSFMNYFKSQFNVELSERLTVAIPEHQGIRIVHEAIPSMTLWFLQRDRQIPKKTSRKKIHSTHQIEDDGIGANEFVLGKFDDRNCSPYASVDTGVTLPTISPIELLRVVANEILTSVDPMWSTHLTSFKVCRDAETNKLESSISFSWFSDRHLADLDACRTNFEGRLIEIWRDHLVKTLLLEVQNMKIEAKPKDLSTIKRKPSLNSEKFLSMSDEEFDEALSRFEKNSLEGWPDNPPLQWAVFLMFEGISRFSKMIALTDFNSLADNALLAEAIDLFLYPSITIRLEPIQFPNGPSANQRTWETVFTDLPLFSQESKASIADSINLIIQNKTAVRAIVSLTILFDPRSQKTSVTTIYACNNFSATLLTQLHELIQQ